jgi:putative transposase
VPRGSKRTAFRRTVLGMGRFPRCELPDGFFHVTTNSVHEARVFRDDDDRRFFLRLMRRVPIRFSLGVHVYCLMGTHYHLLVEGTTSELSTAFEWLNGVYAREHNARHGRKGHLFGERFASWVIRDERHRAQATGYILDNPVRAGLVERREDWPWSGTPGWTPPSPRSARGR